MIFWMRRAARSIAGELRGRLHRRAGGRLDRGRRDGLPRGGPRGPRDRADLLLRGAGRRTSTAARSTRCIGGIAHRRGHRLPDVRHRGADQPVGKFFTWTGALLILVAAGILKYGVHDFQEAGVLPGLNNLAFDISGVLDPSAWYAALLAGMFNITPAPTVLETIAWVAYGVPVLVLFLRPPRASQPPAATPEAPPRRPRRRTLVGDTRPCVPPRILALAAVGVLGGGLAACAAPTTADDTAAAAGGPDRRQGLRHRLRGRPDRRSTPAPCVFTITNGGNKVTEFYVYAAGRPGDGRGGEHRPRPLP